MYVKILLEENNKVCCFKVKCDFGGEWMDLIWFLKNFSFGDIKLYY